MRIDVHLGESDIPSALRRDVRDGLTSDPKLLPPKWFYDDRGSELFDAITRLPEYYPTRCEREILVRESAAIAASAPFDTLVELGSGTSEKTRVLIDTMWSGGDGSLRRFVPFDVSEATLRASGADIEATHTGLEVHGVVGDFDHHLGTIPSGGRRLVALLGGTIGNFGPPDRKAFLAEMAAGLEQGDGFLLGTDLVKDARRLEAAYDDSAGITADFNRNVLRVINRELHADFEAERFAHVARWDAENEWIEMLLRSDGEQSVYVRDLDLTVQFAAGELMRTEISAKFRRAGVEAELANAGLDLAHWWTDAAGDFALSLAFAR